MQTEQVLDYVAQGKVDATILDSNLVEIYLSYRDDLRVATNFSSQRDIAWGVRKNAPQLLSEINRYLQLEHMVEDRDRRFLDDFDAIKKRRVLRVLLRNNAASYFLYRGELMGFEYELAREFAEYHGLRLEVVVPPSHREMTTWLLEGRADIAMGFIEPGQRQRSLGIEFSRPYHYARQHVVVPVKTRRIARGSAYIEPCSCAITAATGTVCPRYSKRGKLSICARPTTMSRPSN